MNRKRPWTVLVSTLIVVAAFCLMVPSAASASTTCGSPGVLRAGYDDWPSSPNFNYGTQARIIAEYAAPCPQDSTVFNAIFASVQLDQAVLGGGYQQMGYYQDPTSNVLYFAASAPNSGPTNNQFKLWTSGPTFGNTNLYTIQYNSSTHNSLMGYDYQGVLYANFDLQALWTQGRHNDYRSSTVYSGTDIPGSSSAPADYQYLAVQEPLHACCQTNPPPLSHSGPPGSRYYVGSVVYNSFATYTR